MRLPVPVVWSQDCLRHERHREDPGGGGAGRLRPGDRAGVRRPAGRWDRPEGAGGAGHRAGRVVLGARHEGQRARRRARRQRHRSPPPGDCRARPQTRWRCPPAARARPGSRLHVSASIGTAMPRFRARNITNGYQCEGVLELRDPGRSRPVSARNQRPRPGDSRAVPRSAGFIPRWAARAPRRGRRSPVARRGLDIRPGSG